MKRSKKIITILALLATSACLGTKGYAAAEKQIPMYLVEESYISGEFTRTYLTDETEKRNFSITIPNELLPIIEQSEQPVLEAKKQLTAAYKVLGLTSLLDELNHEYKNNSSYVYPRYIHKAYQETFEKEKKKANNFADKQALSISKEDMAQKFDLTQSAFLVVEEVESGTPEAKAENVDEHYGKGAKDSVNWVIYGISAFVLALFGFIAIRFSKRKSRR